VSALPTSSEMTGEPHAESIEFELTPADLLPPQPSSQQAPDVKKHIVRSTGALATLFAFVVLRSIAEYDGLIEIPPQAADKPLASPPQLASEKPYEPSSPVRMANPFDSSEVFEFPPGTSRAEARESVANLLLQRARERRPQWGATKRRARQHGSGDTSPS